MTADLKAAALQAIAALERTAHATEAERLAAAAALRAGLETPSPAEAHGLPPLPPLPQFYAHFLFTADQMRDYARAAIAANVQPKGTAVAWRMTGPEDYGITSYDKEQVEQYKANGWTVVQELFDGPSPAPEDGHGPKCLKGMLEDDEGAKHPCTCGARKPPTRGQLFTALNEVAELIGDCEEWAITEDPQVVVSMVKDYMAGVSLAIQAPAVGADDAKRLDWLEQQRSVALTRLRLSAKPGALTYWCVEDWDGDDATENTEPKDRQTLRAAIDAAMTSKPPVQPMGDGNA